jgi:hypothetical protein
VIHPKFVRYLRPIAEALSCAWAFLAVDDPHTYQWLEAEGLPRVGVELTPMSRELTRRAVKVGGHDYTAEPFDYLAIKFNAVRNALTWFPPDCIVVAEGNAPNCD